MKFSLLKAFHYALFVIFFALLGVYWFLPVSKVIFLVVLGIVFLVHTYTHGASVSDDMPQLSAELVAVESKIKSKLIAALHSFVDSLEAKPTAQATKQPAPITVTLNADTSQAQQAMQDLQTAASSAAQAVSQAAAPAAPLPSVQPTAA